MAGPEPSLWHELADTLREVALIFAAALAGVAAEYVRRRLPEPKRDPRRPLKRTVTDPTDLNNVLGNAEEDDDDES